MCRWSATPFCQQAATKPVQLSMARQLRLRVPDTLISNDREAVLSFVDRHRGRVIHKTLAPAMDQLLFTKRWDAADTQALGDLELAPMIFQEQIGGSREPRVTIVGEEFFAAEFEEGEYVFLELNPQGQFLYSQIKTGMPISAAVADLLCSPRARRTVSDRQVPGQTQHCVPEERRRVHPADA
jgi:hypothetical protein